MSKVVNQSHDEAKADKLKLANLVGFRLFVHVNPSVECGDITFVRAALQGEQSRYN